VIKAVTAICKQKLVRIERGNILSMLDVVVRVLSEVATVGTIVPLIIQASSERSISFVIPAESADYVLESLQKNLVIELSERDVNHVWVMNDVAIITVVGFAMRNTPRIAGQIVSKLGDHEINILAIVHGSSDVSISMIIETKDMENAVKALHELIPR